jgi:hypothetical protein
MKKSNGCIGPLHFCEEYHTVVFFFIYKAALSQQLNTARTCGATYSPAPSSLNPLKRLFPPVSPHDFTAQNTADFFNTVATSMMKLIESWIAVFLVITPCYFVGDDKSFSLKYCLHFQSRKLNFKRIESFVLIQSFRLFTSNLSVRMLEGGHSIHCIMCKKL